ncbi:hypothetical protein ACFRI7_10465 [Streptomyces sp. NPDC056716]
MPRDPYAVLRALLRAEARRNPPEPEPEPQQPAPRPAPVLRERQRG